MRFLLTRLQLDPPLIFNNEFEQHLKTYQDQIAALGLVIERAPLGWITCDRCGDGHRCELKYATNQATQESAAYANCPECGLYEVPKSELRRWQVDLDKCLATFFSTAGAMVSVNVEVPGRLWKIGRMSLAGRSRELFFVRFCNSTEMQPIEDVLKTHPKAILFVPDEASVSGAQAGFPNSVFSLETLVSFDDGSIRFETEHLGSCLRDLELLKSKKKSRAQRGERAAKIEKIEDELKQHLVAAFDHAKSSEELNGYPVLLPRPTQKEIADRLGFNPTTVHRCLNDTRATELKVLWETAESLDRVMEFAGSKRMKQAKA